MTRRGRELLKEMERLGIILDATHLCDESFWDAMKRFEGPVWASHSNCRVLANWNRQFSDDQIKELIRRGAVIGMAFDAIMMVHRSWSARPVPAGGIRAENRKDLRAHRTHLHKKLAGNARHVGIGTDLDGGYGTEQTPEDLDSIADIAKIGDLLAARGYRPDDIDGIFFGNFVGFLRKAWR